MSSWSPCINVQCTGFTYVGWDTWNNYWSRYVGHTNADGYCCYAVNFETPNFVSEQFYNKVKIGAYYSTTEAGASPSGSYTLIATLTTMNPRTVATCYNPDTDYTKIASKQVTIQVQDEPAAAEFDSIYQEIEFDDIQLSPQTDYYFIVSPAGDNTGLIRVHRRNSTNTVRAGGSINLRDACTITYDGNAQNSGTVSSLPATQTVYEGYDFQIPRASPTHSSMSTDSTKTVTLNGNGGTSLDAKTFTRTVTNNYAFNYWQLVDNGSVIDDYAAGETVLSVPGSFTLKAVWRPYNTASSTSLVLGTTTRDTSTTEYTVTLNAEGGTCSSSSMLSRLVKIYSFRNWNTNADGSGTSYEGTGYQLLSGDTTLYAQWSLQTIDNSVLSLPTPLKPCYTFRGWADTESATSGAEGNYIPTQSLTLYAIWSLSANDYELYLGTQKIKKVYLGEVSVKIAME